MSTPLLQKESYRGHYYFDTDIHTCAKVCVLYGTKVIFAKNKVFADKINKSSV